MQNISFYLYLFIAKIKKDQNDDFLSVKDKIHKIEHECYVEALNLLIK